MFDTAVDGAEQGIEDLDAAAALARAVERRRAADAAEAELLAVAAHWADLHALLPGQDADGFTVPGAEELVPLAGPGTPAVAEFAPAELAAALGMSSYAGQLLVGDALELRHRLPRTWARIQALTLPAWRGRRIAEATRALPMAGALWVDAQVSAFAHKIGPRRLADLVTAAVVRFDPEQAAKRAKARADGRGVWLSDETTDGTRSIRIEADALDAAHLDRTLEQIASALSALGDTDSRDVRRAKAVGVVADPQEALDVLSAQAGTSDLPGRSRRGRRSPTKAGVTLYVHLHQDAIRSPHGRHVARAEGLGPITVEQIQEWLGRDVAAPGVTITPVLDLDDRAGVDAYETPDRTAESVYLRSPCCPFPWCTNTGRRKDSDHVRPYDPDGPPGQTSADNLAPLCRRHHRMKTLAAGATRCPNRARTCGDRRPGGGTSSTTPARSLSPPASSSDLLISAEQARERESARALCRLALYRTCRFSRGAVVARAAGAIQT